MKKPQTRDEKIQFVKEYMKGSIDSGDEVVCIKMDLGDRITYSVNGKDVSETEYEKVAKRTSPGYDITLEI